MHLGVWFDAFGGRGGISRCIDALPWHVPPQARAGAHSLAHRPRRSCTACTTATFCSSETSHAQNKMV